MFNSVILGLSVLLVVDGFLVLASSKGLIGRIFPLERPITRIFGGLLYLLIGGFFLYVGWRGLAGG